MTEEEWDEQGLASKEAVSWLMMPSAAGSTLRNITVSLSCKSSVTSTNSSPSYEKFPEPQLNEDDAGDSAPLLIVAVSIYISCKLKTYVSNSIVFM
jgi:hypothetical protein